MSPKSLPILDAPPMSGAAVSPAKESLNRAAPPELSQHGKEHFTRVNAIAAEALRDLETVHDEIGKLRDEITLRAHMLGEATIEFDELVRAASQGYGSIRKALEMVRHKFAGAAAPVPATPAPAPKDAPPKS